jgi:hypothetical protein
MEDMMNRLLLVSAAVIGLTVPASAEYAMYIEFKSGKLVIGNPETKEQCLQDVATNILRYGGVKTWFCKDATNRRVQYPKGSIIQFYQGRQ